MKLPSWFQKYWFLLLLVLLIALGITLGFRAPQTLPGLTSVVDPRLTTGVITLLMSLSLDGAKLAAAFRAPGPVIVGFTVNVLIVPLMGLSLFPLQSPVDLKYGLLIAASVPCTLAAASVWTRKAGGNDAISLLVTLTTSLACFLTTPFWLSVPTFLSSISTFGADLAAQVTLTPETRYKLGVDLILGALLPTLFGQLLRQQLGVRCWADRKKPFLGAISQGLILLMVLVASIKAGGRLAETQDRSFGAIPFLVVFTSVILIHILAFYAGTFLSRKLEFSLGDQVAVGLAGSQKTLPTGLLIATELGQATGMTFALFPMLMYHAAQLLIDTLFVSTYARRIEKEKARLTEPGFS